MHDRFVDLLWALQERGVRFVLIGVWGANHYAQSGGAVFETQDRDLLLPLDPANLLQAWEAADATGLSLWARDEPLDMPRDLALARAVTDRRALVRATDDDDLQVDFTLVMAGFDFEAVWRERRTFRIGEVDVPVARLLHIVQSKETAGRDKDRRFLATHEEALRQLLGDE